MHDEILSQQGRASRRACSLWSVSAPGRNRGQRATGDDTTHQNADRIDDAKALKKQAHASQ
jgi:hypothetical protein